MNSVNKNCKLVIEYLKAGEMVSAASVAEVVLAQMHGERPDQDLLNAIAEIASESGEPVEDYDLLAELCKCAA